MNKSRRRISTRRNRSRKQPIYRRRISRWKNTSTMNGQGGGSDEDMGGSDELLEWDSEEEEGKCEENLGLVRSSSSAWDNCI